MHFRIKKGIDLPLPGAPRQVLGDACTVREVAVSTVDDPTLRVRALVGVGQRVRRGEALAEDRQRPRIRFASPAAGVVTQVRLGTRRRVEAIVVDRDGEDEASFEIGAGDPSSLPRDDLESALLRSGLWTALRTRPFDRIPNPGTEPFAIFVTALDTDPHAPDPAVVLAPRADDFASGVLALTCLTPGLVHACTGPPAAPSAGGLPVPAHERVRIVTFEGPHPAGLPGLHVHRVAPVGTERTAWHVGYQDVVAIGRLVRTGRLDAERVVSVAGPPVRRPELVRVPCGAAVAEIVAGRLEPAGAGAPGGAPPWRTIAGSVLNGRAAEGSAAWLGRHHRQVSVLEEAGPGRHRGDAFTAARWPRRTAGRTARATWTTARHGRVTGLVPTELYEEVFPFDLPLVPLLRALEAGDVEAVLDLGGLELAPEDLALLTYVAPSKIDHGDRLRTVLDHAAKELGHA